MASQVFSIDMINPEMINHFSLHFNRKTNTLGKLLPSDTIWAQAYASGH